MEVNDSSSSINRYKKKKVMLVDDEEDIAFLIKKGLEMGGRYEIETYNDALEALGNFKSNTYDLVLIDIVMPAISGFSFCEQIMRMDSHINNNCKICFISASEYTEEEMINMIPGLEKYRQRQERIVIYKPIKLKVLARQIGKIMGDG